MRWFITTVLTSIVSIVIGVYSFDTDRVGFNVIKPNFSRYQNEIKLSRAIILKPNVLIMGNSRAEVGFDPDAPALSRMGALTYNLAIPGTGIAVPRGQLEHLHRVGHKPKLIILGLDFLDFIDEPEETSTLKTPENLQPKQHPVEQLFWRFDILFSLTSLRDVLNTLIIQHKKEPSIITPHGFNPLNEYRALALNEGYYPIFRQRAEENAKIYLKKARGSLNTDLDHPSAILEMAAQSDIDVRLIIYPYHAQILVLFETTGLWHFFEDWKLQVTSKISALKKRYPEANIELFDFSGYSFYNCEHIPNKEDRKTETRWYWEGGHFKKELGDIVLEQILSEPNKGLHEVSGTKFGMKLEQQNVFANRQRIA